MADYEFSAPYVDTFVRGLRRSGQLEAMLAKASMEAAAMAADPFGEAWQPAKLVEELGELAASMLGEAALNDLTYRLLRERFGPIVLPLVKSALAANKTPAALLKKTNDLVRVAIRGIEVRWLPSGDTSGTLTIQYPRPVAPHVSKSWEGMLRFVFEETSPGTITVARRLGDGSALEYLVEWTPPTKP